jgi:type IV pilus assembly protein PilM
MYVIGLTLEKDAFRIAVLKKEKTTIAVDSLEAFSYGKDNVKQFYNLPPFHTGKEVEVVSGLVGETFIRKLHLPLKEKRKILSALPFQLESLIPFAAENPIVCLLLKKMSHQMTAVTVIATAESHLAAHIAALKEMDIEPDAVSCGAIALTRFATWQFPQEQRILCFDVQDQKIFSALIEDGELALSQTIYLGGKQEVSIELEKFSVYLKQKGAIEDSTPWLLTGKSDEVRQAIKKIFPGPCLESQYEQYAMAIGLALDRAGGGVQFLQKKFTPAHTHAQRKKKLIHFLGICFIAALLMSIGGAIGLHMKQRHLVKKLASYFPASVDKDSISSVDQIEKKLREWENSTRGQKSSFAFLPTVPKVSDFLAWLSTHPGFATEDGGQKEGTEIKSVHYSLTKYPKIGEPSSPYSAQVEMEFTSTVPRSARDFHEALLKGDQMVNAKKEIKWQTQNQTYYTSFELNKAGGS